MVHFVAGLDFLGLGLDQVPSQVVEELLEKYPRLNFKAEFRNLLVEHRRHHPAAQVLTWTDDVARTAVLYIARSANPDGIANYVGGAV